MHPGVGLDLPGPRRDLRHHNLQRRRAAQRQAGQHPRRQRHVPQRSPGQCDRAAHQGEGTQHHPSFCHGGKRSASYQGIRPGKNPRRKHLAGGSFVPRKPSHAQREIFSCSPGRLRHRCPDVPPGASRRIRFPLWLGRVDHPGRKPGRRDQQRSDLHRFGGPGPRHSHHRLAARQ